MKSDTERQLMRLLHDELPEPEASNWRRRLEAEPELAALYSTLERSWSSLQLPEPPAAGAGFAAALRRRIAEDREPTPFDLWRLAPTAGRLAAAATLALGIAIGVFAASGSAPAADDWEIGQLEASLAESYWEIVEGQDAASEEEVR